MLSTQSPSARCLRHGAVSGVARSGSARIESLEPRLLFFANNSFLSEIFASVRAPVHEDITIEGLSFAPNESIRGENFAPSPVNPIILQQIVTSDVDQDLGINAQLVHAQHFDDSYFAEGAAHINSFYTTALHYALPQFFDPTEVAKAFGAALHTIQDFYAHTNWVDVGETGLIDSGLGYWGNLSATNATAATFAPYSIHGDAVLLEMIGTPPTPKLPGEVKSITIDLSSKVRPAPILVTYTNGKVLKGIISGTVEEKGLDVGTADHTPPSVAQPHDYLNHDYGHPDYLGTDVRPNFQKARDLAVLQTRHEFARLAALIRANDGGDGAVERLVKAWSKPDASSLAQVRKLAAQSALSNIIVANAGSGLTTTESGGKASFTVVLKWKPSANVDVGVSSTNTSDGKLDKSSLRFTPLNWSVPQKVTVTGADAENGPETSPDGDATYAIHLGPATSTDVLYNGVTIPDLAAKNKDDDYKKPPQPPPAVDGVTPLLINLGVIGGAGGGSQTAVFNVTVAKGVTWKVDYENDFTDMATVSLAQTGTSLRVTITMAPQSPTPGFTDSDYSDFKLETYLGIKFSDGPEINIEAAFTERVIL